MANNIKRQVVLHNTTGSHNKYYEISVKEMLNYKSEPTGKYFVQARWGRIENFTAGDPQSQVKVENTTFTNATGVLGDLMFAKLKKGYKVKTDTASGHAAQGDTTSKSMVKRVAAQKNQPVFDRTEHVEVVVSDWWSHDNIEERAV